MNPYVSANEKAQLIRVILMEKVLHDAIDIYASLDSTDKAFLAELRHGRTRINKAVKLRRLSLDNDADDKLLAGAAKLEPMFLARPEAKKAHKELLELQSTLPMNVEDLQDWYGFVIEVTCKNCTKSDYAECPARRVLSKYEICPMDPGAKGKCQYSYVGTPEAEELQPIDTDKTVPAIVYNAALAMVRAKEDSINENYVPAINQLDKELSAAKEQVESLHSQLAEYDRLKILINDIIHPDGDGPTNPSMCDLVAYIRGDRTQYSGQISEMQDQLIEYDRLKMEISNILHPEDDGPENPSMYDIVVYVRDMDAQYDSLLAEKNELVKNNNAFMEQIESLLLSNEINPNCNSDKGILGKGDSITVFLGLNNGNKVEFHLPEYMTARLIEDMQRPNRLSRGICAQFIDNEFIAIDMQEVVSVQVANMPNGDWVRPQAPLYEFTTEQDRYRIDCKCGAEYFANMNTGRLTARCRDCHEKVFTDLNAEKYIGHDGKEASPMTNKYFVSNQPRKAQPAPERATMSNVQDIRNNGRDYKDPCQLFG